MAVAVPIYDSLGENAVEYIVKHADVELIFVDITKLPQFTKVRTCNSYLTLPPTFSALPHEVCLEGILRSILR